jgi:hypothetical protein
MAVRRAVMDAPAASSRRRRDGTTLVVISVFLQVLKARNRNAESKITRDQYGRGRSVATVE